MKPAPFDYLRPAGLDAALDALAGAGDEARVLAGGQSLMAMLSMRLVSPAVLVDVGGMRELDGIERVGGGLRVGAAVTQARLLREVAAGGQGADALLAQALPWVGHLQTRCRGTVCGSLAHADPSGELPLCLAALDGGVELASRARGRRTLPWHEFLEGALRTACADDEMVVAATFPAPPAGAGVAFREVAQRHGDFAVVAFAAVVHAGGIRFAVGGVEERPVVRDWPPLGGEDLDDALAGLAAGLDAQEDPKASAAYRRRLVRRIGRRTIDAARGGAPA